MSDNHATQPMLTVSLPANDWAVVRAGLYELPLKIALPVASKLEMQLAAQAKPAPVPETKETAP